MTSRFALILVILALVLPFAQLQAASVMVNEYRNGSSTVGPGTKMVRDEYIEFVITENTSAASLASLTFGDSNDATSMLQGVFRFDQATLDQALANANLTQFLPGTLIVVKGINLGAQQLNYDPLNGGWAIELVAGQGARDHSETLINGNINFGNNGDVVWISSTQPTRNSDTSGLIHAIGHDNAPGAIATTVAAAFGSENILASTITTGRSVANVGGEVESLVSTTTATMGQLNGGANSLWIDGLRTGALPQVLPTPEPGRAMLSMAGIGAVMLRRQRKGGAHA